MMSRIILAVFIFSGFHLNLVFGYDDQIAHPDITKNAAELSILDRYMKMSLGFEKGIDSRFPSNSQNPKTSANELLKTGSIEEDKEMCRRGNHMHNPRKTWDVSYMDDVPWTDGCYAIWGPKYSNITWATSYLAPPPDGVKAIFPIGYPTSPYNWDLARDYYYKALTFTTRDNRDKYFALTFRTIGHVLHLLQDMAVPAHTRNDFASHLIGAGVYWGKGRYQPYEYYVQTHSGLITGDSPVNPSFTDTKLTNYWDTDKYNGNNPSTLLDIGLAEFSNANYFSDYTIPVNNPTPKHQFPYPNISDSQSYQVCLNEVAPGVVVRYMSRKNGNPCPAKTDTAEIDHFAVVGLFSGYPEPNLTSYMWLDDNVHKTYANELLPRAVGYSAGLLDYFFRGSIDISLPGTGVYAKADNSGPGFTSIKLKATNITTTGENMTEGTIQLVVKYKLAETDPFQSEPVTISDNFYYTVVPEKNNVNALYIATPTELNFDLSQNYIPLWATDLSLQLVYHGKLANEDGTVNEDGAVAVGFKDISESTPIDIYNNMDKICINGGWHDAGSESAKQQAPDWDVYPHKMENISIKTSSIANPQNASPTNFDHQVPLLAAGNMIRSMYILGDYQDKPLDFKFNYSIYRELIPVDQNDLYSHQPGPFPFSGNTIKNQVDYNVQDETECTNAGAEATPCDIRYYPLFYRFRGENMWGPAGVIFENPGYPENTDCNWGDL